MFSTTSFGIAALIKAQLMFLSIAHASNRRLV